MSQLLSSRFQVWEKSRIQNIGVLPYFFIIIQWNTPSLFSGLDETVQWIFEISACDVLWRLCFLPSLKKQKHNCVSCRHWRSKNITSVQCIIKQFLDSIFVISRTIKLSVRVLGRSRRLRLTTPASALNISNITKPSSDNCWLSYLRRFGGLRLYGSKVFRTN